MSEERDPPVALQDPLVMGVDVARYGADASVAYDADGMRGPSNGKADCGSVGEEKAIVYANKRAEMWGTMREWLAHGAIPAHPDLLADLTALEYGQTIGEGRDAPIIERKEDMKERGLASPDLADALALTFAYSVVASDHTRQISTRSQHQTEYEPYTAMHRSGRTTSHQVEYNPARRATRRGTRSAVPPALTGGRHAGSGGDTEVRLSLNCNRD